MTNPFTAKAKTASSNPFTKKIGSKKRVTSNPGWNRSSATQNAPKHFDWIKVGMNVRLRWPYERHLASQPHGEFVGKVYEREEWIKVISKDKCHMIMPLFTKGLTIERVK